MRQTRPYGFTLVEVMIVVAIIGVLAAIAYPIYTSQVYKGRRAEATSTLVTVAQGLERCFAAKLTYVGCPNTAETPRHYTVNMNLSVSTFTLTATPKVSQSGDTKCSTFTLNQAGKREAKTKGGAVSTTDCW